MKRDNVDILACPVCNGGLSLTVSEEVEGNVRNGSLHCARCDVDDPDEDGIPDLLPPETTSPPSS